MHTASQAIADWSVNVVPSDLSENDINLGRRALVDTIAVSYAGREEEASRLVRRYALDEKSRQDCVLWATGDLVSDELAALVNGTVSHVLDFDDVSSPSRGHPSVVLWPAIFAVAERNENKEIEAQTAFAIGLELVAKLGRHFAIPHVAKGWHSTPTFGVIGAAVACSWLLRLDAVKTANAIGIAVAQAAGTRENFGTMSKSLQAGIGASAAVRAAKLARLGYDSGPAVLDGPAGFSRVYGEGESFETFIAELSKPFETTRSGVDVKRYPLCYATHRAIEAILKLRGDHHLTLDQVQNVEVMASNKASLALIHDRPTDSLEAKFSMQYAVAAALLDGSVQLESFTNDKVNRADIQSFFPRVVLVEERGDVLPRWARVSVTTKDRRTFTETVSALPGSAEFPLTNEHLLVKVESCLGFVDENIRARRLFDTIMTPTSDNTVKAISALLKSRSVGFAEK